MNSTKASSKIDTAPSKPFCQELLVIAPSVPDYQHLLGGLRPDIAHLILDSVQDPITQITERLHQLGSITDLHIVSHGAPGCLYLMETRRIAVPAVQGQESKGLARCLPSGLNLANLSRYQEQLYQWRGLKHLYLWGCNVGAGDAGQEFLGKLQQLTQAEISASSTPIGHPSLGGNWELDVTLTALTPRPLLLGEGAVAVGCVSRGDKFTLQPTNQPNLKQSTAPAPQGAIDFTKDREGASLAPLQDSYTPLTKGVGQGGFKVRRREERKQN